MRLFIAAEIPEEIRKKLFSIQKSIPDAIAKIKWVEKENIHMTLKFLGEVSEVKVDGIKEALAALGMKPFECSVKGFGTFPNEKYVKVIWAGIEPAQPFIRLHEDIDNALLPLGFEKDPRFSPHVTVGRVRFVRDRERLRECIETLKNTGIEENFTISGFVLKNSTLTEKGPVYETVKIFAGK
ncbi:MAG: RNA 2',3'-cyclic phosphodiesterase [Candidatus Aenigmatarchaeota archaeon]|nr:MAG: RNA 2',3'-cyclic phosphodiesterase [Candidatus Aenigmarchaeota archaeon]